MTTFGLPVRCLTDGAPLELVSSTATDVGTAATAVLRCATCRAEFFVAMQLRPLPKPKNVRRNDRRAEQLELVASGAP